MALARGTPLPDLSPATHWFGQPPTRDALIGKPLLIHIWSVSCHTCHEIMPETLKLRDELLAKGWNVIGLHIPRQESDLELPAIEADIREYALTHAQAVDNDQVLTEALQNEFVPAFYAFGPELTLEAVRAGANGPAMIRTAIARMESAASA